MLVEQAIFTSARTRRHQGYQVVARSASVPDEVGDFLAKWGPTHGSLLSSAVQAESINFTAINREWVAVSRTLFGGPEYSARGAFQVVTQFLILRRRQMEGYENNAVSVVRTAKLLGQLWLPASISAATLPPVNLPATAPRYLVPSSEPTGQELVGRALAAVSGHRLALIGAHDPVSTIEEIVLRTSRSDRLAVSFTTGLVPSQHRSFQIHMLPELDAAMHDRLSHQDIRFLAASV